MEKKQKTVVALLYDFDKTLCTQDMQNYSFIPSLGMSPHDFWEETNEFVEKNRNAPKENNMEYNPKLMDKLYYV